MHGCRSRVHRFHLAPGCRVLRWRRLLQAGSAEAHRCRTRMAHPPRPILARPSRPRLHRRSSRAARPEICGSRFSRPPTSRGQSRHRRTRRSDRTLQRTPRQCRRPLCRPGRRRGHPARAARSTFHHRTRPRRRFAAHRAASARTAALPGDGGAIRGDRPVREADDVQHRRGSGERRCRSGRRRCRPPLEPAAGGRPSADRGVRVLAPVAGCAAGGVGIATDADVVRARSVPYDRSTRVGGVLGRSDRRLRALGARRPPALRAPRRTVLGRPAGRDVRGLGRRCARRRDRSPSHPCRSRLSPDDGVPRGAGGRPPGGALLRHPAGRPVAAADRHARGVAGIG